jgi:hypothetical protein
MTRVGGADVDGGEDGDVDVLPPHEAKVSVTSVNELIGTHQ